MNRIFSWSLQLLFTLVVFCFVSCEPVSNPEKLESPISPSPTIEKSPSKNLSANDSTEKQHGVGDVVRAKGTSKMTKLSGLQLEPANWDAPKTLTFRVMTKEYRYYRKHKAFSGDGLPLFHGAAVEVSGAIMPIDSPGPDGEMKRFWLANPKVVMAGCVFCNPPTLADLIYVQTEGEPFKVDREELYRSVIVLKLKGRFFIESKQTNDGVEYLFRLNLKEVIG